VAAQYFEEILLDLKKKATEKVDKAYFSVNSQLARVSVNVCGAAEAPEEQAGK